MAQSELDNLLELLFTYNGGLIYPTETKEDKRTLVLNASLQQQNFTITGLTPDYNSVRTAIINSLKDFFLNEVGFREPASGDLRGL